MAEDEAREQYETNPRLEGLSAKELGYEEPGNENQTCDDETLIRHFQTFQQQTDQVRIAEQLEKISTITSEISQPIREYIQNLKYPKALIGDFKTMPLNHSKLKGKVEMSEKAIKLFQFINTILQDPKCVQYRSNIFAPNTENSYAIHISRYVLYIANHTDLDEFTFRIDGVLMARCFQNLLDTENSVDDLRAKRLQHMSINTFRCSLNVLQHCLGIFDTRSITDVTERAQVIEQKWKSIPLLHELENFRHAKAKEYHQNMKKEYTNKSTDALFLQNYTIDQFKEMLAKLYEATFSQENVVNAINQLIVGHLGHHLLFGGNNIKKIELSDLVYSIQDTGHGKVPFLGVQFPRGNSLNSKSSPGLLGVCRNKDVEICLISSIAMSLWFRFDFPEGPLYGKNAPDFMDKSNWYDLKLLFGEEADTRKEICRRHLLKLMKTFFKTINFKSEKETHIGRVTQSERARAHGVHNSQILRQSGLFHDILEAMYISSFAYDFVHFSGGFSLEEVYFIARDIPVPKELQAKIFPWLEPEIEKLKKRPDQSRLSDLDKDCVAPKFLGMLNNFRSIILQDLALMTDITPNSVFSKHPITQDPVFLEFKKAVKERCADFTGIPNLKETVDVFAPQIGLKIQSMKAMMQTVVKNQRKCNSSQLLEIQQLKDEIPEILAVHFKDQIADVVSQMFADNQRLMANGFNVHFTRKLGGEIASVVYDKLSTKIDASFEQFREKFQPSANGTTPGNLNKRRRIEAPPEEFQGPEFRMLESETSVISLWEEWYISTPQKRSIEELDDLHKSRWRTTQYPLYKRKKKIILVIAKLANSLDIEDREAADVLEEYRQTNNLKVKTLHSSLCSNSSEKLIIGSIVKGYTLSKC